MIPDTNYDTLPICGYVYCNAGHIWEGCPVRETGSTHAARAMRDAHGTALRPSQHAVYNAKYALESVARDPIMLDVY